MEASAIKQHRRVGGGVRNRTPLLRMQSDERLVTLVRRGHQAAFGALVSRYEARLLAFCRHLLRSREDAEDVLQEVFASAFKAMMADDRPIRVRPWLYRIARNRCLNHLRRISAIGVDSIEDHLSEHGPSTSDLAQRREDLWQLVGDIQQLPESQRSALLLREMEALSYEQIAEVLDKTIPSVKSLLIRARRSLAESAEVRSLSCEEARVELDEVAAGLRERPSRVVRRHIASCRRCPKLGEPEHSLAAVRALLPLAPVFLLKKLSFSQLMHSARAGSTATAAGASAAAGPSLLGGATAAGFVTAGVGGLAGKAAVGLTAAALGFGGAVVVDTSASKTAHPGPRSAHRTGDGVAAAAPPGAYAEAATLVPRPAGSHARPVKPETDPPSSARDRTTTTTAPATKTPAPAVPGHAKPGRSQKQVVVPKLPGGATHVSDATDATADPALPSGPTVSSTPTGSGGAAPTGTTSPSATTPSATTPDAMTPPGDTGTVTTPTGTTTTTTPPPTPVDGLSAGTPPPA
jgi:RNA polymerase sigma factor (sigma-70 family)